jgi:hypothetical protein
MNIDLHAFGESGRSGSYRPLWDDGADGFEASRKITFLGLLAVTTGGARVLQWRSSLSSRDHVAIRRYTYIGAVGNSASTGAATSVNFEPVDLRRYVQPKSRGFIYPMQLPSAPVFDRDAHGIGSRISLEMQAGCRWALTITSTGGIHVPGRPVRVDKPLATTTTISLGDEYAGTVFEKPFLSPYQICAWRRVPSRQTSYRW